MAAHLHAANHLEERDLLRQYWPGETVIVLLHWSPGRDDRDACN
jgi:hypothetical protein